jgi:hypothetical protein
VLISFMCSFIALVLSNRGYQPKVAIEPALLSSCQMIAAKVPNALLCEKSTLKRNVVSVVPVIISIPAVVPVLRV